MCQIGKTPLQTMVASAPPNANSKCLGMCEGHVGPKGGRRTKQGSELDGGRDVELVMCGSGVMDGVLSTL